MHVSCSPCPQGRERAECVTLSGCEVGAVERRKQLTPFLTTCSSTACSLCPQGRERAERVTLPSCGVGAVQRRGHAVAGGAQAAQRHRGQGAEAHAAEPGMWKGVADFVWEEDGRALLSREEQ